MPGSLARAAPIRFLIGVTLVWTTGRGIVLAGWADGSGRPVAAAPIYRPRGKGGRSPAMASWPIAWRPPLAAPAPVAKRGKQQAAMAAEAEEVVRPVSERTRVEPGDSHEGRNRPLVLAGYDGSGGRFYRRPIDLPDGAAIIATARPDTRWSGSMWIFARGGGMASGLSPAGQIGGGQAGARLLYRFDRAGRLAAAARLSAAIGGVRQTETAIGLDFKPVAALPLHLMAERRIALDRGGRNAWTLGAAGGADDVRLAPGWRLDGYAEAGVVGANRRDPYADGALRIARALALGGGRSLAIGGGAWGAAQPGAERLDLGPSLVLRLPVAERAVALALDWRERMAGGARPGSGIAFTLATDF